MLWPILHANMHLFWSRKSAIQSLKTGKMATSSLTTYNKIRNKKSLCTACLILSFLTVFISLKVKK